MPLSEHEQRLLEQMERALYADDPKLASTLRGKRAPGVDRRRVIAGAVALVGGLALIVTGVATVWPVGVVGFLVMLGGGWLLVTGMSASKPRAAGPAAAPSRGGRAAPARRSFMERFEQRWDRRRDGGS